jgi:hypothetical protein
VVATDKDGLSSDCAVLRVDPEFATLADFLTLGLVFGVGQAELFDLVPHERDCFGCVFQGCLEAGVFGFDLNH